jgi:Vitamin K-dependent gamma-carboxylase
VSAQGPRTTPTPSHSSWWFRPVPLGRVAALRVILYLFVFVDVLITTSWIPMHAHTPAALYQPLFVGRILPVPHPGPLMVPIVQTALLLFAAIALTGRAPRLSGAAVCLLYLQWMLIGFSYGKVNHDRVAFLVALAVLPTAGAARLRDERATEAAGWAVRSIQVAVVLTYFLATFAKLRYGGLEWLDGSTLMRGVLRRGTFVGDELKNFPEVLHAAQYGIVAFELSSPLMLLEGRLGRAYVGLAALFHLVTWACLKITFLPHTMCLLAFLPLERIALPSGARRIGAGRGLARRAGAPG